MTNYEKITASLQTTKGLANFLMETEENWCTYCGNQAQCDLLLDDDINPSDALCAEKIAQWLESEST